MSMRPYNTRLHGRNIRLVRFTPDDTADTSPVNCYLAEACLDSAPRYYALLYVWGDPDVTESIVCNGCALQVTVNPAKALRRLQKGYVPPKVTTHEQRQRWDRNRGCWYPEPEADACYSFWIDAICIDQQVTTERNHQVQMMKDIYSQATGVVVWLGDIDYNEDDVSAAVQAIKLFASHRVEDREDVMTTSKLQRKMQDLGVSDIWTALNNTFSSRWYKRLWCVQEVALARESSLLFNSHVIHSRDVVNFHTWLDRVEAGRDDDPSITLWPQTLSNMEELVRRVSGSAEYEPPLSVLSRFRALEANDPRDNVYGLLGLLRPWQSIIEVDYNETTARIYTDTVVRLIAHDQDLRVLSHVDHHAHLEVPMEMPSWVSRWDWPAGKAMCPDRNSQVVVHAGSNKAPVVDITRICMGIIRIQGLRCGSVKYVTPEVSKMSGPEVGIFLRQQKWTGIKALATTLTGGHVYTFNHIARCDSETLKYFFADFKEYARLSLGDPRLWPVHKGSDCNFWIKKPSNYENSVRIYANHRRLFRTDRHWVGLGPACMRKGDVVAVMTGVPMPFVLRHAGKGEHYLMGECFIYDIATGQAYDILEKEGAEERMFELI